MVGWLYRLMAGNKQTQQAMHPMRVFPYLQSFVHGYFHQDFDIVGDTVTDIVTEYKAAAHAYDVMGLKADIARFIHQYADNADEAFVAIFNPDIDPVAWSGSTIAWLREVEKALDR